ncbi:MAG: hypothetical protein IT306_26210 [Chloroflexi bacterium]|nr:hypothetical protein [Chloroflexota bacterium]
MSERATAAPPPRAQASRSRAAFTEGGAVLLVLAGCIPLLWPLAAPGMVLTHDGFLHVQRLIALDAAAREGAPFTRWLPDLAYGYGQPLLLYYAPLSYLPALLFRLLGAGFVASFELTSGLALVLSALAMYALARSLAGVAAAGTAALVYAALPYQLVDLYVRGVLAESWAFVWLPLAALGVVRAMRSGDWRWTVAGALALAGLVVTHNVTALLYLPALAALLALTLVWPGSARRMALVHGTTSLGLGLALAAWFWLPALAERQLVQIDQTLEPKLFASFFLTGWLPFRLDPAYDYTQPVSMALDYPIFWPQMGLVQTAISLAGLLAVGVGARTRASATITTQAGVWAGLLVGGGLLLQTSLFFWLYQSIPLLKFVQFPWRLLAVVGLGSALLAGLLVESLRQRPVVSTAVGIVVVLLSILTATIRLDPERLLVDERHLTTESIVRGDLAEYGLGSTHSGEYLPVSSGQRNANRLRKTMLEAGGGRTVPEPLALTVERVEWRANGIVAEVTSTSQATERLVFSQFAFDGWTAAVDGSSSRALAVGQLGLLGVTVTPGSHRVELTWSGTATAARQQGLAVSAVAALVLLGLLGMGRRLQRPRRWMSRAAITTAALLVGGMLVAGVGGHKVTPASAAPSASWQIVDDTLALVETHQDTARMANDGVILTRQVWLVRRSPPTGYRAVVEIVAGDGTSHLAPWVYEPISRLWERGQLTRTDVAVRLPASFPAGRAAVRLVFERPAGLAPIDLGTLEIPVRPLSPEARSPLPTVEVTPDGTLVAAPADWRTVVRTGDVLDVLLRWSATAAPHTDREFAVSTLLKPVEGGRFPRSRSDLRRPGDWFAPLPFWQAGDAIEQPLRLRVHDLTPPGQYTLTLDVYGRDLARGGASEPGASGWSPREQERTHEYALATVTVER